MLNPMASAPTDVERHRDPISPEYDPDIETWVAPFFMGAVNTRIVLPIVRYQHNGKNPMG